ncbi:MAG: DUF4242 domain-containing protein [Steroidobacteraceae bacterium]
MKALIAVLSALFLVPAIAADLTTQPATAAGSNDSVHRYLVERTFPSGALEGLDAATKAKVNSNNASVGVRWVQSYANADKTRTFCVYEGPSEAAVRKAATLNSLPVDRVTEVPVDLDPGVPAHSRQASHRYLIERTFAAGALDGLDAATKAKVNATNSKFGVSWVTSYANAGKTKTYCIYDGPSEAAIRQAAKANGLPVDSVTEVPVTLLPK